KLSIYFAHLTLRRISFQVVFSSTVNLYCIRLLRVSQIFDCMAKEVLNRYVTSFYHHPDVFPLAKVLDFIPLFDIGGAQFHSLQERIFNKFSDTKNNTVNKLMIKTVVLKSRFIPHIGISLAFPPSLLNNITLHLDGP